MRRRLHQLREINRMLKTSFKSWDDLQSNEEDHQDSWWTTFLFKDIPNPNDLHVTHKYFGTVGEGGLTEKHLEQVMETLDEYFEDKEFHSFRVDFDEEEMFGEDKDVRVLSPSNLSDTDKKEFFLLDLKEKLDEIYPDDWAEYKPHVSTEEVSVVDRPIVGFYFMRGSRPYREYTDDKD